MPPPDIISTTNRIIFLARSGLLLHARKLFDEMRDRDTIAWNAMLTAYSSSGLPHQSLSLFSSMRIAGVRHDDFTLTAALSAASDLRDLATGSKLHALVVHSGFNSLPVTNALIDLYGKCSRPLDAERVFETMERRNEVSWCSVLHACTNSGLLHKACRLFNEMPVRNIVAWNTMIVGCRLCNEAAMSMVFFKNMAALGFRGDAFTLSGLMNACAELGEARFGWMIHSAILQVGWIDAVEVSNSIFSFYVVFGCISDAVKIFQSMRTLSQVSWNAMIDAHMKAGDVEEALSLFKKAPKTNIISWTSMIAGYARNGHGEEALSAFAGMVKHSYRPDDFTFGAVLHACATLAVVGHGKMIHSYVIQYGFGSSVYVANSMVNMYAKCGDIEGASRVFNDMQWKDVVSWNAMILGFALHGRASEASEMYKEMIASNVVPDEVTFMGLLMSCNHSGLIEEGGELFGSMESAHGVFPDVNHATCIVDMFGRAGHLEEASKLIEASPGLIGSEDENSFKALLGACSVNGDLQVGNEVGKELVRTEPEEEAAYVMLSNLYCASGQWTEAERVRTKMAEQRVKKEPGCSWIEVRDMVKVFMSGSRSLADMPDAYEMLGCLQSQMRNLGCISNGKGS